MSLGIVLVILGGTMAVYSAICVAYAVGYEHGSKIGKELGMLNERNAAHRQRIKELVGPEEAERLLQNVDLA